MKVTTKDSENNRIVLKINNPSTSLTAGEFMELCYKLYKKVTYVNPVTITIHGGVKGDDTRTYDPTG